MLELRTHQLVMINLMIKVLMGNVFFFRITPAIAQEKQTPLMHPFELKNHFCAWDISIFTGNFGFHETESYSFSIQ